MLSSLFSIFEVDTGLGLLNNWLTLLIPMSFLTNSMWGSMSWGEGLKTSVESSLKSEFNTILGGPKTMFNQHAISLFFTIVTLNLMGMVPYGFTATSHMVVAVSLGLGFWLSSFIFSLAKNPEKLLAHMVPMSTPGAMTSFMVCVESLSFLIRPMTLAVRLAANMMAGHMLLCLAGEVLFSYSAVSLLGVGCAEMGLTVLELTISIIQSYVFTVLVVLYMAEA